jgi:cell division septation protein DedD/nucleoid DNA-binding protein
MNILKYITELLEKQDCVIVPGFGAFVTEVISSQIHPITHRISPPRKLVRFNAQVQMNDGLLASYISYKEGIPFNESLKKINRLVEEIQNTLQTNKRFDGFEFGHFISNKEQKIEFILNNHFVPNEFFGLPDLLFTPIERNAMEQSPIRKSQADPIEKNKVVVKPKNNFVTLKVIMFLLPLTLMLTVGGYVISKQNKVDLASFDLQLIFPTKKVDSAKTKVLFDSASTVDVTSNENSKPQTKVTVQKEIQSEPASMDVEVPQKSVIEKPKVQESAVIKKETITNTKSTNNSVSIKNETTSNYVIVVGAFKVEENAKTLAKKLKKEGLDAVLLPVNDKGFSMVVIDGFNNLEEAASKKNELTESLGSGIWVKKN